MISTMPLATAILTFNSLSRDHKKFEEAVKRAAPFYELGFQLPLSGSLVEVIVDESVSR